MKGGGRKDPDRNVSINIDLISGNKSRMKQEEEEMERESKEI